jgi:hypothetical protein
MLNRGEVCTILPLRALSVCYIYIFFHVVTYDALMIRLQFCVIIKQADMEIRNISFAFLAQKEYY